jgi:hypothetical protein
MKKLLLTFTVFGCAAMLQAQVIFNVLTPSNLTGNYELTHASDWAATPDLNNPANVVIGELAFVSDGTAADSLGCLALTNAADIVNKIAVIYRGECQFGVKARNANIAGAIAVVIINNVPGSPVGMAAGDVGDEVNIPVVMISLETGALLREEILAGNVTAFIGNKQGFFDNDLGFFAEDIYLPNGMSIPALVAQNGSEFNYTPAVWLHNYGAENTTAARFDAVITYNGTPVYTQFVTGISIAAGSSIYVSTPMFAPTNWAPGLYEITLTASFDEDIAPGVTDDFPGDNVYTMNLMISADNIFTRSSINPDGTLLGGPAYRTTNNDEFSACVAFTHPQASRLAFNGLHFGITGRAGTSIENEVVGFTVWRLLEDPSISVEATLVANGEFDIPDGAENGEIFFAPVRSIDEDFLILENNEYYAFCVGTDNPDIFILFDGGGLDNRRQYESPNGINQPDYFIFTTGLGRFLDFYGQPAIGVEFFDKSLVGLGENNFVDVTPYPNPATQFLNIPLNNLNGAAQLNIFDATGRMISSNNVNVQNNTLTVDVQDMATGIYTFTMSFDNGKTSSFKVMINK